MSEPGTEPVPDEESALPPVVDVVVSTSPPDVTDGSTETGEASGSVGTASVDCGQSGPMPRLA